MEAQRNCNTAQYKNNIQQYTKTIYNNNIQQNINQHFCIYLCKNIFRKFQRRLEIKVEIYWNNKYNANKLSGKLTSPEWKYFRKQES